MSYWIIVCYGWEDARSKELDRTLSLSTYGYDPPYVKLRVEVL